jgi:soluble lytic murein transglycosylase-like protein
MPKKPSDLSAPLPGEAVRSAVLDAARRNRSARPYVIPGVLVGGLAAPIVAMGTTGQPPVSVPGADITVTDTTVTTTVQPPTPATTTAPTTTAATTPEDPETPPAETATDRSDGDPPPDPSTTTTTTTTPAPPPEPSPTGIPTDPAAAQLVAKVKAAKKHKGRGSQLKLSDHERRLVRDAERNSDIKKAQTTLGPSSAQSSAAFNDLLAMPGGGEAVPEKAISSFQIPPFLLPIYQAAGAQYGIRWEVLAAINEIETNYGRNVNVSSAGAQGWMQFMPSTWEQYGTDANRDGRRDPYNPVDAIFAAGRYLKAAGANTDLRRAIFSYNHADWYVNDVLKRARRIASIPPSLTDALAQMAEGYFPIAGKGQVKSTKDGANIKTLRGSAVIAVQDGEIVKSGTSKRLGRYIQIRDGQGTVYTYGNLQRVGLEREGKGWARRLPSTSEPVPDLGVERAPAKDETGTAQPESQQIADWTAMPSNSGDLFTGATSLIPDPATAVPASATKAVETTDSSDDESEPGSVKKAKSGRKVVAGTVLGRAGDTPIRFEIRPRGAGRIDPSPILSGWKLLQTTALFRVKGRAAGDTGQVLLMSKEALQHRVLHDPRIKIYEGGRVDVAAGIIDRRVLATLAFLAESGLDPTVSCLRSGHSLYTASGNISEHSSGNAVDISAINGIPIIGHQGKGSITETAVRKLLALQGGTKPHQIITLMKFAGTDNTFAMADHNDHIHVGFHPTGASAATGGKASMPAVLKPDQWDALVARIGSIDNPKVSAKPSASALRVARQQLKDAAEARELEAKDARVDDYDSYQAGVKDPFIPPWLARDQV